MIPTSQQQEDDDDANVDNTAADQPTETATTTNDTNSDTAADQPTETATTNTAAAKNDDLDEEKLKSLSTSELITLIIEQNSKLNNYEEKLKHSLADFLNLQKRIVSDIQTGIYHETSKLFLDFLQIYDDFIRAKKAYSKNNIDTTGLDSILKNMDAFLNKNDIKPIDALGEIFDPSVHEAISVATNPDLDDDIITKEIRKGYISQNRVIRVALVEISKRDK